MYCLLLPSADTGLEFCTQNSTENEKSEASNACTVKVMTPPDSMLE